ncbi:MAG: DUF3782 domain-containing protein [Aigarchaeota archaeon]|nr:DUF3782 domain-containing protein [Candidatus Pelearchaeum maunauluense]
MRGELKDTRRTLKQLEVHSRQLEAHSRYLERLVNEVGGLKTMLGSFTSRSGVHMERMVLELLRKTLLERVAIDVDSIEKRSFVDERGELVQECHKIEIDIYMTDKQAYALEVKTLVESKDVDWIVAKKRFLERSYNMRARWLIVASAITQEAYMKAIKGGIEVVCRSIVGE